MEYWEDKEYKVALKQYSYYCQMCYTLNAFDPKNDKVFNLRDESARKMKEIKENYITIKK